MDIEARQGEEVLQGVLEFHPGQTAELDAGRAGFGGELRQRGVEFLQEDRGLVGRGSLLAFGRRHLAGGHRVMELRPLRRVRLLRAQRGQVQSAFLRLLVVAFEAMLLQERPRLRRRRGDGEHQQGSEADDGHLSVWT